MAIASVSPVTENTGEKKVRKPRKPAEHKPTYLVFKGENVEVLYFGKDAGQALEVSTENPGAKFKKV